MKRQVVLAYSGGLDTSVILKWLVEERGFDVIAFIADVGQGEDLEAARLKAERTGATKTIVRDLTAEFVADYIFPMIRANTCLLYTSPSPRDRTRSRMPSSA